MTTFRTPQVGEHWRITLEAGATIPDYTVPCVYCGAASAAPTTSRLSVLAVIVPLLQPVTACCGMPEEPSVRAFGGVVYEVLDGPPSLLSGRVFYCSPFPGLVLEPLEDPR